MEKKIRDLNELYKENKMFYHCNACGDINISGKDSLYCGSPEEMPAEARELYETVWSEGSCWPQYVVSLDGRTGMALSIVIETAYVVSLAAAGPSEMEKVYDTAIAVGKKVAQQLLERLPCGEVYYGEDGDPCGDEVVIYLEKDKCAEYWDQILDAPEEFGFFTKFEEQFAQALNSL